MIEDLTKCLSVFKVYKPIKHLKTYKNPVSSIIRESTILKYIQVSKCHIPLFLCPWLLLLPCSTALAPGSRGKLG